MNQGANASLCAFALLLGGCVLLPPQPAPAPAGAIEVTPPTVAAPAEPPASAPVQTLAPQASPPQADAALRDLLAFNDRARQLSPQDLAAEMARLNDELPGPRTTLQLALLLGQTRNNGDISRALVLLEPLLRSTAPEAAPWQPLARLLASRFAEQRRLEEQIERQAQQARDNQRKLEQLNDKLEALKAIERNLTTRPPANGAASAPAPGPKGSAP